MAKRGKQEVGLTFDQANALFLHIFIAALIGGKFFLFFEDPYYYLDRPSRLLSGRGFVFYGSFLFAVPTMLWFFRKHKLDAWKMLDVMAITTCLVHIGGRLGCFLAGCCYGLPTDSFLGVAFSDPLCMADPKNTPLHPTQLYEATFILVVMFVLLAVRGQKRFDGQLFMMYLMLYAAGRFVIEYFRGDIERGLLFGGTVSHSQLIAIAILVVSASIYYLRQQATVTSGLIKNRRR